MKKHGCLTTVVVLFALFIVVCVAASNGGDETSSSQPDVDGSKSSSSAADSKSDASAADSKSDDEKPDTETKTTEESVTPVESEDEYRQSCETVNYKDLARNPDDYKGKRLAVTIEINQVLTEGIFTSGGYAGYEDYDITGDSFYQKEWYIDYTVEDGASKILEDDVITFYGEFAGTEEMERLLTGEKVYIPELTAKYYDLISE
jgi:hypothetical protein